MTKREYFAALALQAIIMNEGASVSRHDKGIDIKNAITYADDLMEQLSQSK